MCKFLIRANTTEGNDIHEQKNLAIQPPGFKIHFEEAVQKALNEHMISKSDIAFYDFEHYEMKRIRKITKVYDNVLVNEIIIDNKNCLVVLKTESTHIKKEDTKEIRTNACSVNQGTIKQENSLYNKSACQSTISLGQVNQATVKEEQHTKTEKQSNYDEDKDLSNLSTDFQENNGLKRPSTTNYQDDYDISFPKKLRTSDNESDKVKTQKDI
ncbi:unnamed protein product [Mytilus coruscus]|uniref:Uncharacterized protein n=1 Tax=Mytilus coruscus TaxID=42192 RepID=A0A6J8DRR9_MYTCO|nr:unnamed protein product [Mytilus coruscus]